MAPTMTSQAATMNDESAPLQPDPTKTKQDLMITGFAAFSMVCFSVSLIHLNNFLMQETRFPYAVPLVWFHMTFCSTVSFLLFQFFPSFFPAISDPLQKVAIDQTYIVKGCLPIAVVFTAALVLTNLAYTHLSVAFLQMIKETNIIWVYIFSLVVGFEVFGWPQVQCLMLAAAGMVVTVRGEMHFVMIGFLMQFAAILLECVRIILQGLLLSDTGGGRKLDPLSYVLLITPICTVLLTLLLVVTVMLPPGVAGLGLALPSYAEVVYWLPWLIGDAAVAFCLNVSIAAIIKRTSPMSYIFCQLMKDMVAVGVGVVFVGEEVSHLQFIGFLVQISAIVFWSLLKNFPDKFKTGLVDGLASLFFGGKADTGDVIKVKDAA